MMSVCSQKGGTQFYHLTFIKAEVTMFYVHRHTYVPHFKAASFANNLLKHNTDGLFLCNILDTATFK